MHADDPFDDARPRNDSTSVPIAGRRRYYRFFQSIPWCRRITRRFSLSSLSGCPTHSQ
jgi:hypothetical protein